MGFSQGAAACYAWAASFPQQILSVAGLAGFVPEGIAANFDVDSLKDIPVFMAHGSRDNTVPIEIMRSGARVIENTGARLTICEDDVGHKLSSNCMRGLGHFYDKVFQNKP
jgi:phospholipase/carboxylesterase